MASNYGKNSSEYKIVRILFGLIVKRSQYVLSVLANELFSKDLISVYEHGKATNNNQPAFDRASVLISSILTKIENDSSYYSTFVEALRESDLRVVADDLESALSEEKSSYSPSFPLASVERATQVVSRNPVPVLSQVVQRPLQQQAIHTPTAQTGNKPTLPMLISFKCKNGKKINVLEKIGVKYSDFGVLLLNDDDGSKVSAIVDKNMREAKPICTDIVKLWLQGEGRPVSWKTLVEVLEDIGLRRLAEDIRSLFL